MIFFDDQTGNCQTVSKLGVTCVLTPHGVTRAHFEKGLEEFAKGKTGTIVRLWKNDINLILLQYCMK